MGRGQEGLPDSTWCRSVFPYNLRTRVRAAQAVLVERDDGLGAQRAGGAGRFAAFGRGVQFLESLARIHAAGGAVGVGNSLDQHLLQLEAWRGIIHLLKRGFVHYGAVPIPLSPHTQESRREVARRSVVQYRNGRRKHLHRHQHMGALPHRLLPGKRQAPAAPHTAIAGRVRTGNDALRHPTTHQKPERQSLLSQAGDSFSNVRFAVKDRFSGNFQRGEGVSVRHSQSSA